MSGALEAESADVVATDFLILGAYLGAEHAGLPFVAFVHTVYPLPIPGLPPFGFGFKPAPGPIGRLRDRSFAAFFALVYGAGLSTVNTARAELGLTPLAHVFDIFASADRELLLTSATFDFPATKLPANLRYIGPLFDDSPAATLWQGPWPADDQRPLVVASLSTTVQKQEGVLRQVNTALGLMPVRALVTVGPSLDPAAFQVPANVAIAAYIPHRHVFPQADAVITHGGHGTTIAALASGVPVLCLPMGRDQGDISARLTWHGAGLSLSSKAKPKALRRALTRLLNDPTFRVGARRIADAKAREDSLALAVAELEQMAASQQHQTVSPSA